VMRHRRWFDHSLIPYPLTREALSRAPAAAPRRAGPGSSRAD
jgi:hypothetical protein